MPAPQYNSGFEAAVGSFLSSYAAMRGLKRDERESAAREREAKDASRLRQAQLADAGYVSQDLTVPDTKERNWAQSIGHRLFGSDPEHREALLKIGPSASEREAAAQRDFTVGRDTANFAHQDLLEGVKAANDRRLQQEREAGADRRNDADNASRIRTTTMEVGPRAQAQADQQREHFFDQAVAAAGGDPIAAMRNVERFQMPQARKFAATRTDYHAAAARYRDSKAALAREGYQVRTDVADSRRNPLTEELRRSLYPEKYGPPHSAGSQNRITPTEYQALKAQGFSDAQIKAEGYELP